MTDEIHDDVMAAYAELTAGDRSDLKSRVKKLLSRERAKSESTTEVAGKGPVGPTVKVVGLPVGNAAAAPASPAPAVDGLSEVASKLDRVVVGLLAKLENDPLGEAVVDLASSVYVYRKDVLGLLTSLLDGTVSPKGG